VIGDRWGVTPAEVERSYPCDALVRDPVMEAWRGRILAVTAGEALTGRIMGAVMSYVLVPEGEATGLLLKVVLERGRAIAPLLCIGDLVMARRQLLNLARLAEESGSSGPGVPGPQPSDGRGRGANS
jgi:hypothetical protein